MNQMAIILILSILAIIHEGDSSHNRKLKVHNGRKQLISLKSNYDDDLAEKRAMNYLIKNFILKKNRLAAITDDAITNDDDENGSNSNLNNDLNSEDSTEAKEPKKKMKFYIIKLKNKPKTNFMDERALIEQRIDNMLRSNTPPPRKGEKIEYSNEISSKNDGKKKNKPIYFEGAEKREMKQPRNSKETLDDQQNESESEKEDKVDSSEKAKEEIKNNGKNIKELSSSEQKKTSRTYSMTAPFLDSIFKEDEDIEAENNEDLDVVRSAEDKAAAATSLEDDPGRSGLDVLAPKLLSKLKKALRTQQVKKPEGKFDYYASVEKGGKLLSKENAKQDYENDYPKFK